MVRAPRIVYFGTPQFAVPPLEALLDAGYPIAGVVTQPDRPRGRGQRVTSSPVKAVATARGLAVLQPERLASPACLDAIGAWEPELGVVAAYGRLLPQALLDLPRLGFVNVHASLLPRWRGAAPVHRAILAGDARSGVTIMRVALALDAGPLLSRTVTPIDDVETSGTLEARLSAIGATLLVQTIGRLDEANLAAIDQDERDVTYAARLERREGPIDWARPARDVHNHIRGLQPWPLACAWLHSRRVIVRASRVGPQTTPMSDGVAAPGTVVEAHGDRIVVAANPGLVRLTELQTEGRRPQDARSFLNGTRLQAGDRWDPGPERV